MNLLNLIRTKSQQASHDANQEQKRRQANNDKQQRERNSQYQRDAPRRPEKDLLGIDFAGKHQTILRNPFVEKKKDFRR